MASKISKFAQRIKKNFNPGDLVIYEAPHLYKKELMLIVKKTKENYTCWNLSRKWIIKFTKKFVHERCNLKVSI